jgi:hypothetical protein
MSAKKQDITTGAQLRALRDIKLADKARAEAPADRARRILADHERVIENARRSFVALGQALLAIRTERLYVEEFSTFAEYCEARWDLTETHVNRVINAALVAIEATPIGVKINSEAIARELVGLDREQIRQVWDAATARAAGGRITAALVREVRRAIEHPTIDGETVDDDPRGAENSAPDEVPAHPSSATDTVDAMHAALEDLDAHLAVQPGQRTENPTSEDGDRPNTEPSPALPEPSGVSLGSAPAEQEESRTDSPPAGERPQDEAAVVPPAAAPQLVETPIGPMTRKFAEQLDRLVPDPNPHREWQTRFLDSVFAAAKAMRGYTGAEIAAKADDQLRAEFADFVGEMDALLHETSKAQLARADNVRPLRRVK